MANAFADALLEAASGALLVLDAGGTITRVNAALASNLGEPAARLVGRRFTDLVRKDDRERAESLLRPDARGTTVEVALVRIAGEPAQYLLGASVMELDGAPHVIVAGPDVSQQRQLEGRLVQGRKYESVGRLARGVAHDFNNVLAAVMSYAELILMDSAEDDPRREDVQTIRSAALRAADLTRQILAFSRLQTVQPRPIDLNALVTGLDKLLRRVIGEDIELVTMLGEDLPLVEADPGQVEAVLVAEAVSACEGAEPGSAVVIETSHADGGKVALAVRHRDAAVPFTLALERATGPLPAEPPPGTRVRGTETIIVAEDNGMVRRGIAAMLSSRGFTVLPAAGGEEVLRLLRDQAGVGLVLADVVMPGMSAPELDTRIRLVRPGIPVVFMSGYADDAVSRGVVKPDGFIQKPFTAEVLARKLREVLDAYRA